MAGFLGTKETLTRDWVKETTHTKIDGTITVIEEGCDQSDLPRSNYPRVVSNRNRTAVRKFEPTPLP